MPNNKVITLDNLSRFKTDLYADIIMDMNEIDATDQAALAEVYNSCPTILRITTASDGIQMYRLQNNYKDSGNAVIYACLLFGGIIQLEISKSGGTYTVTPTNYPLTSQQ